jgi:hypothetical protein
MQQLREQDHATQGLLEMRILQGKADPEARGDGVIRMADRIQGTPPRALSHIIFTGG